MSNDKKLDRICREVAKELGLTVADIERAARHQFMFVRETMEDPEFKCTRLPYFGKFFVKKRKNGTGKHSG